MSKRRATNRLLSKLQQKSSIALFSHLQTDMGEGVHAQKFSRLLPHVSMYDIPEVIGRDFETLATLNLALAEQGHEPLHSFVHRFSHPCDLAMILSWQAGVAAMLATGVTPHIVKLYAHHPTEQILTPLYQSASLIITESLLASERAKAYGLKRVLYVPHHFTHVPKPSRKYVCELAQRQGKTVPHHALIVGLPSRFEYWKNCECAIEAVRQLQKRHRLILVIKADFPKQSVYPDYEVHVREMLAAYEQEPWLLWDRERVPYPDVLQHYASFDFCLQPSGAEGGSNVVVELMAMGKPVILVEASSNPYLFQGGVVFAQAEPTLRQAQLSYARPDFDSLKEAIELLCDENMRVMWGERARQVAYARFSLQRAKERIAIMLDAVDTEIDFSSLEQQDRELHGL